MKNTPQQSKLIYILAFILLIAMVFILVSPARGSSISVENLNGEPLERWHGGISKFKDGKVVCYVYTAQGGISCLKTQ